MRTNTIIKGISVLLVFLYSIPLYATSSAALSKPVTVAVFQFQVKDPSIKDLGGKISDLIMTHLAVNPQVTLVERDTLKTILEEQGLGMTGIVNDNQAAQIGKLAGAKIFIIGHSFIIDSDLAIVVKVIGTETGVVFTEMAQGPLSEKISPLIEELSVRINKTISSKTEALVAHEGKGENVLEQLMTQLHDKKLPKVSVAIEERHVGAPVIDPAAETELVYYLKQCGFTVVTDSSNITHDEISTNTNAIKGVSPGIAADVMIIGEAFSEYGTRKGELVSCKGRVEVKAVNAKSGEILAIGRKTSSSIDLSEQIAGKNALQQASLGILVQFIPEFVDAWNKRNTPL